MTTQVFITRRWSTATLALALADAAGGCHGGELVFGGKSASEASAGQGGETGGVGSGGDLAWAGRTGFAGADSTGSAGVFSSNPAGSGGAGGAPESGAAGSPPTPATIQLVISGQDDYWKTDATWTEVGSEPADVIVDDSSEAQIWEGFGGAFSERGWDCLTTRSLRDEAMALLFGSDGCRLAWGRIPIGANDYAMDRYTLDETVDDYSMSHFSLERDRQRLVPYVQAALAVKPDIRFWAVPWTPPTWMKTRQRTGNTASPFDGGSMIDDDAVLSAYARYFVKFIQAYAKEGIPIDVVAPQNEPSYSQDYPSCVWTAALYTKFVGRYLGPAFDDAGVTTQLMLGTMSNKKVDPATIDSVMADAAARGYVSIVGLQWGMLDVIANVRSKGLPMWQTEHQCGNYPWEESTYRPTAPNDHAYGVESWGLIRNWIKAGVSAYNAWHMVLDQVGARIDATQQWAQNSLLVVDGSQLIKTPTYYVFRHLSQFVVPGAKVVGTTGGDALAFKNPDGSIVTVMYNRGTAKKSVVLVGRRKLQFELPGNGWATVSYAP
ncbi:MAG: glucosylceramidase [Polyangiaceae bacterium]|nr:glucosylceramidase [Polyangiaceae bacterium]